MTELCPSCATPREEWKQRSRRAPGLTAHYRRKLLRVWMAQGRGCAYCLEALAVTVDHVVPLNRGGTNHEGNLLPACRECNGSKGDLTLMEWRLAPTRRTAPKPVSIKTCECCASGYVGTGRCCSNECSAEMNRRRTRDRYRMRVGLPTDPTRPTKPWVARTA